MWEVPREGKKIKKKESKKKREAGRKRALRMESGISEEHEHCIGSEVKDSSDTFSQRKKRERENERIMQPL